MRTLAAISVGVVILVVSHLPKGALPPTGTYFKTKHALAYGLFAGACLLAMGKRCAVSRVAITMSVVAVVGGVSEFTQSLSGRRGSVSDWLADLAGAGLAVGLWLLWQWWRHRPTSVKQARGAAPSQCGPLPR